MLGGILIDNKAADLVIEKLMPEDFYHTANRAIYTAMRALNEKNDPIDIVTLTTQLRSHGAIEEAGGPDNLARLAGIVPSSAHVAYYAKTVREMSLRRKAIHAASNIVSSAFRLENDVEQFIDEAEQDILSISNYKIAKSFYKVEDLVGDAVKIIEKLYDQKELVTGVPSGYDKLDRITAGFQPSDLIIIAARPSMGKTSLALSIAQYVGIYAQRPVAVFSLEMSKEQIVLRMLCSEARVDNSKVRTGYLGERDFPRIVDAASKIAEAHIYIDDTAAITVSELRAKARRLHREQEALGGLGLIVVDYLQLMRSPNYLNSREQEISDISRSLKALAKELAVPVIALSQLNRSVESRNDKRPVMSDLRESGAIEQDADLIGFIYRDEVYNPTSVDKGVAEIIISKQRNGPIGTVRLAFSPEFTRFDRLEERDDITGSDSFGPNSSSEFSIESDDFGGGYPSQYPAEATHRASADRTAGSQSSGRNFDPDPDF